MSRRLITAATVTTLAATGVVAPQTPALAVETLTASNFRLQEGSNTSSVIGRLDAILPNKSVGAVVDDANRFASPCAPPQNPANGSNQVQYTKSFCWNSDDQNNDWYPQGITSSYDAYSAGTYDGKTVILTSWYFKAYDHGTRVSFVDYSNPSSPKYRHVLLVEPYTDGGGNPNFRAVVVHAGGMAWYGNLLYVVDTNNGFRVFDMSHIWQVSTSDSSRIGRVSGTEYSGFGYKYVLPQALRYHASTAGGYSGLRYSAVALDKTSAPDSLVVGEYCAPPCSGTRLVRFPIDWTSRKLIADGSGLVKGNEAYDVSVVSIQGAASVNGTFYMSTSDGTGNSGDLVRFTPGSAPVYFYDDLPTGCEDLSYWDGRDQLWTLTEYPGRRAVVAIKFSAYAA